MLGHFAMSFVRREFLELLRWKKSCFCISFKQTLKLASIEKEEENFSKTQVVHFIFKPNKLMLIFAKSSSKVWLYF